MSTLYSCYSKVFFVSKTPNKNNPSAKSNNAGTAKVGKRKISKSLIRLAACEMTKTIKAVIKICQLLKSKPPRKRDNTFTVPTKQPTPTKKTTAERIVGGCVITAKLAACASETNNNIKPNIKLFFFILPSYHFYDFISTFN